MFFIFFSHFFTSYFHLLIRLLLVYLSIFHVLSYPLMAVFPYSHPFFEISTYLVLSFLHIHSHLFFVLLFFDFASFYFFLFFLLDFSGYFVTLGNRLPCIKATASSGFFALVSTDLYLPPA